MSKFGLYGEQGKLKLSGKGQSKLKLSGNGNECKPLVGGGGHGGVREGVSDSDGRGGRRGAAGRGLHSFTFQLN
jgi:hypothetical protein